MDTLSSPQSCRGARHEQGFVLIMTLVVLVIITLSSMAMMTLMRGGISASGNIAFRQAATRVADVATEDAFTYLTTTLAATATALDNPNPAIAGYYATHNGASNACFPDRTGTPRAGDVSFHPMDYDFTNAACARSHAGTVSGYTVYYVIHRMANNTGACPAAGCMGPPPLSIVAAQADGESNANYFLRLNNAVNNSLLVYYRVTIKVVGPRRNNRFIQAFVY
jgi:type IV pilus assembly protein PilX